MREYSLVIPVHNELESLGPLFEQLKSQMDSLQSSYEIVFVDDGSTDGSSQKLQELQRSFPSVLQVVFDANRKGQTHALKAGIAQASGRIVITLDADLQNDPADIPKLLARFSEGYDVVCGWRKSRQDTPMKMVLSKFGNILQRALTGLAIHDISCTLRAYKSECAKQLPLDWEGQHRFIPLLLAKKGFKIGEIISNHRGRKYGISKYSHKRIFRVVTDFFKIQFS